MSVILDEDYRDDDAHQIRGAISMVKGVSNVTFGEAVNANDYIEREKIRRELIDSLLKNVGTRIKDGS